METLQIYFGLEKKKRGSYLLIPCNFSNAVKYDFLI
jgi:hypothetical protein